MFYMCNNFFKWTKSTIFSEQSFPFQRPLSLSLASRRTDMPQPVPLHHITNCDQNTLLYVLTPNKFRWCIFQKISTPTDKYPKIYTPEKNIPIDANTHLRCVLCFLLTPFGVDSKSKRFKKQLLYGWLLCEINFRGVDYIMRIWERWQSGFQRHIDQVQLSANTMRSRWRNCVLCAKLRQKFNNTTRDKCLHIE